MHTTLSYLENPHDYVLDAQLLQVGEDEKGHYFVTDKTPFYPQSGGQPSDEGQVSIGGEVGDVTFVKYVDGYVKHYTNQPLEWKTGSTLRLAANKELREVHSRIHTAGHLMDNLISLMPDVNMKGVKGFHFKEGSYVEFIGEKPADTVAFISELNEALRQAISDNHLVSNELVSHAQLLQLGIYLPANLPTDKPLRIVTIGDFEPIPCGGTHALGTADLQQVTVTKAKAKKGRVKVSYRLG